jgi:hypothetical protein
MANRLTDNEKWKKAWFRKLSPVNKCFWNYLTDNCNHAGIWEVDFEAAEFYIGQSIDLGDIKEIFKKQFIEIDNGKRWYVLDYIEFQCKCSIEELNYKNKFHKSVIDQLNKYKIYELLKNLKGLNSPLEGVKEKEKEIYKEIYKEKEEEQEQEESQKLGSLEPVEERTSDSGGPAFVEVKGFFVKTNRRPIEEAILFWNEYEGKNWTIESDISPPRSIKQTKKWQLKAEQWIKKARLKEIEDEKNGKYFKSNRKGTTDDELAAITTERFIRNGV